MMASVSSPASTRSITRRWPGRSRSMRKTSFSAAATRLRRAAWPSRGAVGIRVGVAVAVGVEVGELLAVGVGFREPVAGGERLFAGVHADDLVGRDVAAFPAVAPVDGAALAGAAGVAVGMAADGADRVAAAVG